MKKKFVFTALLYLVLLFLFCLKLTGLSVLHGSEPKAFPGTMNWNAVAKGFEVAELPVMVGDVEADRIMVARIDPSLFKFAVLNDPKGGKGLNDWVKETNAALIVNGSYYSDPGIPETPFVNEGKFAGPPDYKASHGAFVANAGTAGIKDLAKDDWHKLFTGAEAGIVSYPLLIAPDGSTDRVPKGGKERANRSFIAEDSVGHIVIGTTRGAFFSLVGLAEFLKTSPLHLIAVLNLDGGPAACQSVNLNVFSRKIYGEWDLQITDSLEIILPSRSFGESPMPIVLAVFPRGQ